MRFLRLRVGLRFGGGDGAPAYNDAGADTARLDDSVEPDPGKATSAKLAPSCDAHRKFSAGFGLAPAGLKKTKDQQRTFISFRR